MKTTVIKLIDYNFQQKFQLTEAYDDSNSMRYLDKDITRYLIGRFEISEPEIYEVENYKVVFLPMSWPPSQVINYMVALNPDILHMHGSHGWPFYLIYAQHFKEWMPDTKRIFSPAGGSCGTEPFLKLFDQVMVNHVSQIPRMKCEPEKVIVRKRAADPAVFYPQFREKRYDFVYVAAFVYFKQIPTMIEYVMNTPYNLVILGDFTRTKEHYADIRTLIQDKRDKIFLHDFVPQTLVSDFLGQCKIYVWPNIKPENPETTTNRSIVEALACGMPLLLGERAFKDSEFIKEDWNGFKYENPEEFVHYADELIKNYEKYGKNSEEKSKREFNFQENFVDFYNRLYGEI